MTDQELIGYLDRSFGELSQKFNEKVDGLREEFREEIRQTRTAMDEMRSGVQLVANGVLGLSEQREASQSEILLKVDEVKASIGPLFQGLNRRLKIFEEKAERETRDVLEVIRERFGKR